MPGFKKGKHVFKRNIIAKIMGRCKNIATTFAHLLDPQANFPANILDRAVIEDSLHIHATLEGEIPAEIALSIRQDPSRADDLRSG